MNKFIVLIGGHAHHGKDTIAAMFIKKGYIKLAFADELKKQVIKKYNIHSDLVYNQDKKDVYLNKYQCTPRDILIYEAQKQKEIHGENVWVKKIIDSIEQCNHDKFVISDFRYPIEYNTLKQHYKLKTIRVIRDNAPILTDSSEHQLNSFTFDYTIYNKSSIVNLEKQIEIIISKINL